MAETNDLLVPNSATSQVKQWGAERSPCHMPSQWQGGALDLGSVKIPRPYSLPSNSLLFWHTTWEDTHRRHHVLPGLMPFWPLLFSLPREAPLTVSLLWGFSLWGQIAHSDLCSPCCLPLELRSVTKLSFFFFDRGGLDDVLFPNAL